MVLERQSASEKFFPVLVDFGRSTVVAAVRESYLAPEVLKELLYSEASDIYSLGRMLKTVASMVGF